MAQSARLTLTRLRTTLTLAWENTTGSHDRQRSKSDFGYLRWDETLKARKGSLEYMNMWSKCIYKQLNYLSNDDQLTCTTMFTQTFLMLLSPYWWFMVWPWEHVLITTLLRPSDSFEILLISQPLLTFFMHRRPEKDFIQGKAGISHVQHTNWRVPTQFEPDLFSLGEHAISHIGRLLEISWQSDCKNQWL